MFLLLFHRIPNFGPNKLEVIIPINYIFESLPVKGGARRAEGLNIC